jgi:hypothetical protein
MSRTGCDAAHANVGQRRENVSYCKDKRKGRKVPHTGELEEFLLPARLPIGIAVTAASPVSVTVQSRAAPCVNCITSVFFPSW